MDPSSSKTAQRGTSHPRDGGRTTSGNPALLQCTQTSQLAAPNPYPRAPTPPPQIPCQPCAHGFVLPPAPLGGCTAILVNRLCILLPRAPDGGAADRLAAGSGEPWMGVGRQCPISPSCYTSALPFIKGGTPCPVSPPGYREEETGQMVLRLKNLGNPEASLQIPV